MKPHKQTSPAISSIAGRYARMKRATFSDLCIEATLDEEVEKQFWRDIKKVCASALAQDQTKGQK